MNLLIILTLLTVSSCGFLPSGEKVLSKRIKNQDTYLTSTATESSYNIAQGRPIFIEALTYPQYIDGGHVSLEGKLGVMIGRESIRIQDLISLPRFNESIEEEFNELSKNEKK